MAWYGHFVWWSAYLFWFFFGRLVSSCKSYPWNSHQVGTEKTSVPWKSSSIKLLIGCLKEMLSWDTQLWGILYAPRHQWVTQHASKIQSRNGNTNKSDENWRCLFMYIHKTNHNLQYSSQHLQDVLLPSSTHPSSSRFQGACCTIGSGPATVVRAVKQLSRWDQGTRYLFFNPSISRDCYIYIDR